MSYKHIDGLVLKKIFTTSSSYFEKNVEFINSLNVFPVPDGDTGTNMNLTIQAGLKAIEHLGTAHLGDVIKALARGMLLGARGNSGVILSQIWRGMSQRLEQLDAMTTVDFAEALQMGADISYRSVMKPVEGTILTVIRESAVAARDIAVKEDHFIPFLELLLVEAKASLARTQELLPILKEVGVVDSGGQGLVLLLEGMLLELQGISPQELMTSDAVVLDWKAFNFDDIHGEDEFGFCTEFIIRLANPAQMDEQIISEQLSKMGESLVVVHDEDILKVHLHTEQPWNVFNKYLGLGEYLWLKAENMQTQVQERQQNDSLEQSSDAIVAPKVDTALVSVVSGAGIAKTFKELGVHVIVDGGQTANPSTQDILDAISTIDATSYIILPNNSNIILAAEQVRSLSEEAIHIVPSKTIPQGIAATIAFNQLSDALTNANAMKAVLSTVKSGEVTTAVRDTNLNGVAIKSGAFLAIHDKEIVSSVPTLLEATSRLVDHMIDSNSEIVTLIEGAGVDGDSKQQLISYITKTYPHVEVEYIQGDQAVYFYLVGVE